MIKNIVRTYYHKLLQESNLTVRQESRVRIMLYI